jgi:hypothetical protein
MRTCLAFIGFLAACADASSELEWVTPVEREVAPVGDAIELAVASDPGAGPIRFAIDGTTVGVCDPAQPDEDCRRDEVSRWTVVFDHPGTHVLTASFIDDNGDASEVTRTIEVVRELALESYADELADAQLGTGELAPPEPDDMPDVLAAAGRGLLDPDRGFHSKFGGIRWRVFRQRVRLANGIPSGSVSDVERCMNRFGGSIRKWADHFNLSRASVVATALTESDCTNPKGSSDGLSSGPMQVTGSTCAALTGLSRTTCRVRMHSNPDFSFQIGAKYMGSSFQRKQHRRDPPKIAAAYNAGSLRKTFSNRWHMVSTGNHIDRFVRHYNAYRVWETKQ